MNTQLVHSLVQTVLSLSEEERKLFEERIIEVQQTSHKPTSTDWKKQSFFGMWQDQQEMQDSTQWVRDLREKEWGAKDE